jgi:hypothetical protein
MANSQVRLETTLNGECAFSHYLRHEVGPGIGKKRLDYRILCLNRDKDMWCTVDVRNEVAYLEHRHQYAKPTFPASKKRNLAIPNSGSDGGGAAEEDFNKVKDSEKKEEKETILSRVTLYFTKHRIADSAADNRLRDLLHDTVKENGGVVTGSFLKSLDTLYPRNICLQRKVLGKQALLQSLDVLGTVKGGYINMCLDSTTKWGIPFFGLVFQRITHTDNDVLSEKDEEGKVQPVLSLSSNSPRVLAMLRSDVDDQLEIANFASCALDFIEGKLGSKCGSVIHDGNRAETNAFRFEGKDTLKDVHERKSGLPFDLLCLLHLIQLSLARVKRKNKYLRAALGNLKELVRLCRTRGIKRALSWKAPLIKKNRWFSTTESMCWAVDEKKEFASYLGVDNFEFILFLEKLLPVFKIFSFSLHYFEQRDKSVCNVHYMLTRIFGTFFVCGESEMCVASRSILNDLVCTMYKLTLRCDTGGFCALGFVLSLTGMSLYHQNKFVCLDPLDITEGSKVDDRGKQKRKRSNWSENAVVADDAAKSEGGNQGEPGRKTSNVGVTVGVNKKVKFEKADGKELKQMPLSSFFFPASVPSTHEASAALSDEDFAKMLAMEDYGHSDVDINAVVRGQASMLNQFFSRVTGQEKEKGEAKEKDCIDSTKKYQAAWLAGNGRKRVFIEKDGVCFFSAIILNVLYVYLFCYKELFLSWWLPLADGDRGQPFALSRNCVLVHQTERRLLRRICC